jgi:hypothetical protein
VSNHDPYSDRQLTGWAFEGCCMQVARDCLNATTTGVALVNTRGHR